MALSRGMPCRTCQVGCYLLMVGLLFSNPTKPHYNGEDFMVLAECLQCEVVMSPSTTAGAQCQHLTMSGARWNLETRRQRKAGDAESTEELTLLVSIKLDAHSWALKGRTPPGLLSEQ